MPDRVNLRLPRLRDLDRLFRSRRLERRLTRSLPSGASGFERVSLANRSGDGNNYRFLLRKSGTRLLVCLDRRSVLRDDHLFHTYLARAGVLIDLVARTSPAVSELSVEVSDGSASADGIVSFSSASPRAILVPDSDFHASRGYASTRGQAAASTISWVERDATLVWRGSTTGKGRIAGDEMSATDSHLIQRTRLCLAGRGLPGVDLKLTRVVQSEDPSGDQDRLRGAGILGEPFEARSWHRRKFALDVDGNSNAWSNLFTRLLLGCCILKVESPRGFRQWYYDDLRPFEHFVPVAADLSDLAEKIAWCRGHDRECGAIAAAGAEFARRRTFEREMSEAVARLERY